MHTPLAVSAASMDTRRSQAMYTCSASFKDGKDRLLLSAAGSTAPPLRSATEETEFTDSGVSLSTLRSWRLIEFLKLVFPIEMLTAKCRLHSTIKATKLSDRRIVAKKCRKK